MTEIYKELADVPGADKLNTDEVRLAWFLASPSSPLKAKGKHRVNEAVKIVYGNLDSQHDEKIAKLAKDDVKPELKNMINFFKNNEIGFRLRAYFLQVQLFNNFEKIVNIEMNQGAIDNMSPEALASYVSTAIKVSENMPKIIGRIEGSGFIFVEIGARRALVSIADLDS